MGTADSPMSGRSPSASARVTDVLVALAEAADGITVRAVAEAAGTSRSAAHRTLQAFAESGFATQTETGRYSVGPKLTQLATKVFAGSSAMAVADSVMRRLVAEVGETAYLALFVTPDLYATFIHRVECTKPLRYVQPLGTRMALHAGAVGKAILAASDEIDPASLDLPAYTANTLTSPDELRAELTATIARGFALSVEERVEGAAGVAAAIMARETVVGALTITVPVARIPAEGLEVIGPVVKRCANEISEFMTARGLSRF